jgi:2'-5' RNA ligase
MKHLTVQTHFVAVLAPDDIATLIMDLRSWMGARYGCSSGFRTPPHITLLPPFTFTGKVRLLEDVIEAAAAECTIFTARAEGFGAFAERTVFAHIQEDAAWKQTQKVVRKEIASLLPGIARADKRPFVPHLTIANRDIPLGGVAGALEYMATLELDKQFAVDHLALLEMCSGRWDVHSVYPFSAASKIVDI